MTVEEKPDRRASAKLGTLIGERVMYALGEPADLLRVQVRLLWENCYRVNILIGGNAASARVANSYFVETDSNGNIVRTTPKITKQYYEGAKC